MPKIRKFSNYFFPLLLVLIASWLCVKNYTPGTYLLGWDSLHPEFNFPEAFRRIWEGVWRGEQGLGALAAHSHMADVPRLVLLWLEHFIVPASFLRYSYVFLCLIVGPLGVYFFLRYIFRKEKESAWVNPSAFLGALFYLLNLGTLQNFYVPFEMFPAAFAGLPWLFFLGFKFLREGKKSNLIFWVIAVMMSSPMAYAATLWYASYAGLFIFLATFALISSSKKIKLKRLLILVVTAIFLNLYWILPSIYSIANQSGTISNAGINKLFSQEAFLRNADYGNVKNLLLQKNFLFGWRNFDFGNGKFVDLLGEWTHHLSNPLVLGVGYFLAGISVFGLIIGTIKREKVALAFISPLLFSLFFLININPPLGGLYSYLYNHSGIFAEGLRMPFTKFSIIYELILSFYFGYLVFRLSTRVRPLQIVILGALTGGLIYFMLPAFRGQLVSPSIRIAMPVEYTKLFNYLNTNSNGRVALFPINSKYGWEYRSWGYEGSGFLTYGIKNPVLYRDFDRWGSANEDFYSQASFALYSNDDQTFIDTLKKYQVKYLLLDESIVNPGGDSDTLRIDQIKNITSLFGMEKVFNFGFLTVYKTGFGQTDGDIGIPTKFTQIDTTFSRSPVDPAYSNLGDYTGPVDGQKLSDLVSKLPVEKTLTENLLINRGFPEAYNCDLVKAGGVFKSNSLQGVSYRAEGGAAACDYLSYPDFGYSQAYIFRVAGENRAGRGLKIYLFNNTSKIAEIEEILPMGGFDKTFFVYPKNEERAGYTLNLETRSFGRIPSENLLTKVEIYTVKYDALQNLQGQPLQNDLKITGVKKYGVWGYKIDTVGRGLLQLGQSFDNGWVGLTVDHQPLAIRVFDHVEVNSWANGWFINDQPTGIYIIYWPQFLEWGGILVGVITLLVLIFKKEMQPIA